MSCTSWDCHCWEWFHLLTLQPETAQAAWLGKRYAEFIPVFQIMLDHDYAKARYLMSQSGLQPDELQGLETLQKILDGQTPTIPNYRGSASWLLFLQGSVAEMNQQFAQALTIYQKLLLQFPFDPWLHQRLGVLSEKLKNYKQSAEQYVAFLKTFPESTWGQFRLAVVQGLQGQEMSAIDIYEKILERQTNHSPSLNNLAWLYLTGTIAKPSRKDRALELALQAVELDESDDNLDTLAEAYFQSGNIDMALQTIKKAILRSDTRSGKFDYFLTQYQRFRLEQADSLPAVYVDP
ncbi:MAG: tetratricopeptide repeat protein [SAR324 cluster bacterium]|nr:tetratricopeptide repeat protein [SAR324 cluster bacterium]